MAKVAQIKTKPTSANVDEFIAALDDQRKADSLALLKIMKKITGQEPTIWGSKIIGFGDLRYRSPATGRAVD